MLKIEEFWSHPTTTKSSPMPSNACCVMRPYARNLGRNAKDSRGRISRLEQIRKRYEQLYTELLEKKNWTMNRELVRWFTAWNATQTAFESRWLPLRRVTLVDNPCRRNFFCAIGKMIPVIEARFIPIDPSLPQSIAWMERIPFLRTLIREPIYLVSLWRGLREVEVAHIFSASYWSFLVAPLPAWLISRLRRIKTVIHYHSGEARDHLARSQCAAVLEDADRLVVPSRHLVDVFREFGLQAQVVPNIVDLTQFGFRERKPLRPAPGLHARIPSLLLP